MKNDYFFKGGNEGGFGTFFTSRINENLNFFCTPNPPNPL
jgi:hypothetical protein